MNTLIESAKVKPAKIAKGKAKAKKAAKRFAYPFVPSLSQAVARAAALFWSVFGPAARYDFFRKPNYAYAASMKP